MNFQRFLVEEDTTAFFQPLNHESISFLQQKKCPSDILECFSNGLQGFAVQNSFCFQDVELSVDYFLGCSDNDTYDVVRYNKYYNNRSEYVVLGVLLGGDTFGFVPGKQGIYISLDTDSNVDEDVFAYMVETTDEFLNTVFGE